MSVLGRVVLACIEYRSCSGRYSYVPVCTYAALNRIGWWGAYGGRPWFLIARGTASRRRTGEIVERTHVVFLSSPTALSCFLMVRSCYKYVHVSHGQTVSVHAVSICLVSACPRFVLSLSKSPLGVQL